MNFFEQQQRARRRTTLLVLLFALAVLAIVVATNLVVLGVMMSFTSDPYASLPPLSAWLHAHPHALLWTSLLTVGFISGASLFRMAMLASGGGSVTRGLGGTLVDPGSRDPLRRQLLNVVEEMAIAAGVPAPEVYVLDAEAGINALAAGFGTSDAAIAVTRGALESLTRDELQGVVAHEFSHVLNGDMRLNTRLLGITFGILVVGLTGRMILRSLTRVNVRDRSGRGGNVVPLALAAGLALVVVGYIGVLFARLIKAAVSRRRETLADASAVQFTRNPQGLAGALKKIAAMPLRAALTASGGEEVGHMLIAERVDLFGALFATHPPILERIRALEPGFDPAELAHIRLAPMTESPPAAPTGLPPAPERPAMTLLPLAVVATVGNPGGTQLGSAVQRHAQIPPALREAAHSPQDAVALVLALVLAGDSGVRARQMAHIRERVRLPPETFARLEALAVQVTHLDAALRLPLLEIAFPALRRHPPERLRGLIGLVTELLRMDGQLSVLDYAVARLLRVQLLEASAPQAAARTGIAPPKLFTLRAEAGTLFVAMAEAGHDEPRAARAAFEAGMRQLLPAAAPEYAPLSTSWIDALDPALTRLDRLPPLIKQQLVEALVITVAHDRQVTLGEAELLRVVCASLHCPLPPIVPATA